MKHRGVIFYWSRNIDTICVPQYDKWIEYWTNCDDI